MPACRLGTESSNRRSLVRPRRLYGPLSSHHNCIYAGVLTEMADTQGSITAQHRDCPRAKREKCFVVVGVFTCAGALVQGHQGCVGEQVCLGQADLSQA